MTSVGRTSISGHNETQKRVIQNADLCIMQSWEVSEIVFSVQQPTFFYYYLFFFIFVDLIKESRAVMVGAWLHARNRE